MKRTIALFATIFLVAISTNIFAWGTTGHRVVAEIAEQNIKEKTKKEIDKLLDNQHMAYWANWGDFIKSDTTKRWSHTYIWHFVNAPANLSKTQYIETIKNIPQENLYSQIPILEGIIKDKNSTKDEKKEALLFLIHLVGDMHQPMHTGHEEDRGGNDIKIQWFWQDTNLHTLWDSKLIDYEKYSYTEYATVLNVLTKDQKADLQVGSIEDWLYDSHEIANKIYGMSKPGDNLSYDYNYKVRAIVDRQLQKGGLRLAKLLDDLFTE